MVDVRPAATLHGGLIDDELATFGLAPDDVLDVSVNVNPYGPCRPVIDAVRAARIDRYPDPTARPARAAIARWVDVPIDRVVAGHGAVDVLWSLARALVRPGDAVVVAEPAFSELRTAATRAGGCIVEHRARPEDDFAFDAAALDGLLRRTKPRLAYVCTPGNPTGVCAPIDALARIAGDHPGTTLVVDVSFSSLSARYREDVVHASPRIVWVRSLTKDLALPGLRVGFAVAPRDVARAIEASRPPWSVGALAEAAMIAAVEPDARAFVAESRAKLLDDRARLERALAHLGLRAHPSETIYTLVDLGPEASATELRRAMLARHAVLVRDATSFGLPRHVRIGARPRADEARVLRALEQEILR